MLRTNIINGRIIKKLKPDLQYGLGDKKEVIILWFDEEQSKHDIIEVGKMLYNCH